MVLLESLEFSRLPDFLETGSLSAFDCGDDDLNGFLKDDALNYCNSLMAVTYLFVKPDTKEIVAYFCVSNDSLIDKGNKSIWNKINRRVSNNKRRKEYPSAKIGRLGVNLNYQGQSIGDQVLDFIKGWFVFQNKTGCRFLLVDAYNKSKVLAFYQRNDFSTLTEDDAELETRFMYFDLSRV